VITVSMLEEFVRAVKRDAVRDGTRYAREARGLDFAGSPKSVSTTVRGRTDDFDVTLAEVDGRLTWRCNCPSWRNPCKHVVAAALVLKQSLPDRRQGSRRGPSPASTSSLPLSC
jgi:uncharacterized Zn finger protein